MLIKKYKFQLIVLLILIAVNLIAYGFNLKDFFVSDDFDWLYLTAHKTDSLTHTFLSNNYGQIGPGGNYRPLVNLAFWFNYKIWGLNPVGYHLFSLLLHIGICFLLYLIVGRLQIIKDFRRINLVALLAAIFFALLPNHSEAVIWVAAVGDVLAVFFYLLAFYLYLKFREANVGRSSLLWLWLSLLSFMLALFSKEIAITLPFLIVLFEIYQAIFSELANRSRIAEFVKKIKHFIWYIVGLIIYFILRFSATGLLVGYYATDKVKISLKAIYKMFLALFFDNFSYGKYRVILTEFFYHHYILTALIVLTLLTILTVLTYLKIKAQSSKPTAQNHWSLFLFDSYILLCLPVLLLIFNPNNDEGERYAYLPSIIFCVALALIIFKLFNYGLRITDSGKFEIRNSKFGNYLLIASCLLIFVVISYFSYNLNYKNQNWHLASEVSSKIVSDFKTTTNSTEDVSALVLALPDNFEGAQTLRNGFKQAISLYQSNVKLDAILLPVYLQLNRHNYQSQILSWEKKSDGFYAKCADGSYCVTGFDRRESDDLIFELWGYDYKNYTSNQIKLIFKPQFVQSMAEKKIYILVYDGGGLIHLNSN